MLLSRILASLATLEQSFSRLYHALSEAYEDDPEVSGLFFRLSLRKRSHANLVRYQQRVLRHEGGDPRVPRHLAERIDHLTSEIDTLSPENVPGSAAGVLDVALELERISSEEIRQPLVATAGPAMTDLSQLLLKDDSRYRDILTKLRVRRLAKAS